MPYSGRGSTGQGIYAICKINTLFLSGASQFFKATMILKITFPMQSIVAAPLKILEVFKLHTANTVTFKQELIMQINYFSGSMTTNSFIFVVTVVVLVSAIVIIISY